MVSVGGMTKLSPMVKYLSGRERSTHQVVINYSHFGLLRALENGAVFFDSSNAERDLREPAYIDPRDRFPEVHLPMLDRGCLGAGTRPHSQTKEFN